MAVAPGMKSARGLEDGSAREGAVSIRLRRVDDGAGRLPREKGVEALSEATIVLISVVSSKDCSEAWNLSSIEGSMEDNMPPPSPLTLTPPLSRWSHGWPSIPFCVPQHLSVWH